MPFLSSTLDQLLRTGQVRIATGVDGGPNFVLVTRFGIGGDILTEVDRAFARSPDRALIARHQRAMQGALQPLRRMQRTLVWTVNTIAAVPSLVAPLTPFGMALWHGGIEALTSLAWLLPGIAGLLLGAVVFPALRRLASTWMVRRIARRFAAIGQGSQAPDRASGN
jgi:hypothetical protein